MFTKCWRWCWRKKKQQQKQQNTLTSATVTWQHKRYIAYIYRYVCVPRRYSIYTVMNTAIGSRKYTHTASNLLTLTAVRLICAFSSCAALLRRNHSIWLLLTCKRFSCIRNSVYLNIWGFPQLFCLFLWFLNVL